MIFGGRWKKVGEKRLGRGGGGTVYRVVDTHSSDQTERAIKLLGNKHLLPRFRREVETLSQITHPNVLAILNADLDSNPPYFVTEYFRRGNLTTLDLAAQSPTSILELFLGICAGVEALHQAGGVHRDLKPENVLLRDDLTPVVGDFGIVYTFDDTAERLTRTLEQVGSRFFICPENEEGRATPTAACDIYSLGKLLYWMLSAGNKIARRSHRESENNIVNIRENYWLEHANNLLDEMLREHPKQRPQRLSEVIETVKEVRRLIDGRYNPLTTAHQGCRYCGKSTYVRVPHGNLHFYGFTPVNEHTQRVLRCGACGHIEYFVVGIDGKPADWISAVGVPNAR